MHNTLFRLLFFLLPTGFISLQIIWSKRWSGPGALGFFCLVFLLCFIGYWLWLYRSRRRDFSLRKLLGYGSLLLCFFLLSAYAGLFPRGLLGGIDAMEQYHTLIDGKPVKVYWAYCRMPDSTCACDDYYSKVEIENYYLGFINRTLVVDFYAGEVSLHNGNIRILEADECGRKPPRTEIYRY